MIRSFYEAAYIDGASKLKRILHITLPSLMPGHYHPAHHARGPGAFVNYEKILLLYIPSRNETADCDFPTYMYRYGLLNWQVQHGRCGGRFQFDSEHFDFWVNGQRHLPVRSSETSLW